MSRNIFRLLTTQFITAFADNAVLFTAITMVMLQSDIGSWYIPALQASFLVAYVVIAPWVGRFADARPKPEVMFGANLIKAAGAGMLLLNIEPLIAYAMIGLGAALYSPAKYGILPELVPELADEKQDNNSLVRANSWVESSTIAAILSGSLIGALVANLSITIALVAVIALYLISAGVALTIRHNLIVGCASGPAVKNFFSQMRELLSTPRARFATLGVSLFWAAATVLRVLLVAWAPVVLMIDSTTDIAMLTMFVAVGIAIGSLLVPRLIPLGYLRRARIAAYLMGAVIVILATVDNIWMARVALLLSGICGGLFVVPINAALQEIGHNTIGSGRAVAIQNFFENFAMLIASGFYAVVAANGIDPVTTMAGLGLLVIIATVIVSWQLPKDSGELVTKKKD